MRKAAGIVRNGDNARAISPQEPPSRTDKESSDATASLCTFDFCSRGSPWKIGKTSGLWFEIVPTPQPPSFFFSFLFFSLMTSPSSHPSTVVGCLTPILWEPAVLLYGAQGATQDSWNRNEPEWLTAAAPFQPHGVLSHNLPFQGLLLLQKTCWAAKMCWTEKQEENTLLT